MLVLRSNICVLKTNSQINFYNENPAYSIVRKYIKAHQIAHRMTIQVYVEGIQEKLIIKYPPYAVTIYNFKLLPSL